MKDEAKAPNTGTESPASVTYSIQSRDGFNALFTLREETGEKLLSKMAVVEAKLLALLYKPQPAKTFGVKKEIEYVKDASGNSMLCPMCKVGHVKVIHSAKGTFYGCDSAKFDPATKTYTGCKYFSTVDPSKTVKPAVAVNEDQEPMLPEDF